MLTKPAQAMPTPIKKLMIDSCSTGVDGMTDAALRRCELDDSPVPGQE